MKNDFEHKAIRKMTLVGILGNVLLTVFKYVAGFLGNSAAMVSDATHSLSDVLTTIVAYIGTRVARKGPDEKMPYGYDRYENLASLLLGSVLLVIGVGIGVKGIESIIFGYYNDMEAPSVIAIVAAVVSIVVKEGMFWYTMYYAKKCKSSAFRADAWHHRSDALSSVGALVGIGGAMLGCRVLDAVACVVIAAMIVKVAVDVVVEAVRKLVDRSCGKEFDDEVRAFIEGCEGVVGVDSIKTRLYGEKRDIDAIICVDGDLSVAQGHEICERVHDLVEDHFEDVLHIMIHVHPA